MTVLATPLPVEKHSVTVSCVHGLSLLRQPAQTSRTSSPFRYAAAAPPPFAVVRKHSKKRSAARANRGSTCILRLRSPVVMPATSPVHQRLHRNPRHTGRGAAKHAVTDYLFFSADRRASTSASSP